MRLVRRSVSAYRLLTDRFSGGNQSRYAQVVTTAQRRKLTKRMDLDFRIEIHFFLRFGSSALSKALITGTAKIEH